MTPTFSIIIPVYNVAPYLRECLDSVLAQTFANWEAICVDDGSSDGSDAILDEYARRDSRFVVFHKENGGVSSARNVGIEHSNGRWMWFVDADDQIHPGALRWLDDLSARYPNGETLAVSTGMEAEVNPCAWPNLPCFEDSVCETVRCSQTLKVHRRGVCGVLVLRSVIGDLRFMPYRVCEDVLFLTTVFWRTLNHVRCSAPVYYYRQRPGSAIQSEPSEGVCRDMLLAECEMMANFVRYGRPEDCEEIDQYLQWYRNISWYTVGGMLFRVDNSARGRLLPLWLKLNSIQFKLHRDTWARRCILFVCTLFPFGWLCDFLVMFRRRVGLGRLRKLIGGYAR